MHAKPLSVAAILAATLFAFPAGAWPSDPQPEAPTAAKAAPQESKTALAFPDAWLGHWKGDAQNDNGSGGVMKFTMELKVAKTDKPDRYTWTIIYAGDSGTQERPYTLIVKDAAKGEFAIDEGNNIVLDARFLGGGLYSHFVIDGNRIATRERLEAPGTADEHISVEMITTLDAQANTTGGKDGVPEVKTWSPRNIQSAKLRRVKDAAPTDTKPAAADGLPVWSKLKTDTYPGKQDDIFFINPKLGWYVNGAGKIYKTTDGGESWTKVLEKPGTFFRCIAFADEKIGLAGNIGPGYFPNVSDDMPLYRTEDGGETWSPVPLASIEGPPIVGLCALEVLSEKFVNAGNLDSRTRIIGVGRVGGPAALIYSDDVGKSWKQIDIKDHAAMAFDVHFFDRDHGLIAAASDADVTKSNALILTTADGGKTWTKAYQSTRPYELTWKIAFPTRDVGYVTVQSYDPNPNVTQRVVAKTTDGGKTWTEIPLADDAKVRQFGVAFLDEATGWVGAVPNGFATTDGGATWSKAAFGNAVNKIRLVRTPEGTTAYAIGVNVYKAFIEPKK